MLKSLVLLIRAITNTHYELTESLAREIGNAGLLRYSVIA